MAPKIQINNETFKDLPVLNDRQVQRLSLPGSLVTGLKRSKLSMIVEVLSTKLHHTCRSMFSFLTKTNLTIQEDSESIRLEAVIAGQLSIVSDTGEIVALHPGEYHLSKRTVTRLTFRKNSEVTYFYIGYTPAFVDQLNLKATVQACPPRRLTPAMITVIQQILSNPYQDPLREGFHDTYVRELLLLHLTNHAHPLPGVLSDEDVSLILAADLVLKADLRRHYDIPSLAKKVGVNEFKLKRGFRQVFNSGVFERLTKHRIEQAQILLSTTRRTIDDVADLSGYSSRNSFITSFKRITGVTPKEWRYGKR